MAKESDFNETLYFGDYSAEFKREGLLGSEFYDLFTRRNINKEYAEIVPKKAINHAQSN